MQKTINNIADSISKKLDALDLQNHNSTLKKYLKPCFIGERSESSIRNISKIGGYPHLPNEFEIPEFEGQNLKFFCQINFAEIQHLDTSGILPQKGLLVIFMYLENEEGKFTIPNFNTQQLRSFYFEDLKTTKTKEDPSLKCSTLRECIMNFKQYMDIPEPMDFHVKNDTNYIEEDLTIRWELIPEEFEITSPSFKLLGYPTDDAINTYPEWYCFEKNINLMTPGDKSEFYLDAEQEKDQYCLLMQIDLEGMDALNWDDEYSDFGGISIGIRKTDLINHKFNNLLFKYSIS
ncbi:DUF1963 domain-containing protein [Flammeovirga sp. OC4]|uniref:DUF1963 domain-containing protein n=1 Tax=Flammeovirga sp. OC4 TaxID=1382345 RepID=UPI0005C46AC4|nr:DUF1963 domain-containing protein [Flammeovirga sp. OC4]